MGEERQRLSQALGALEFERTKELITRFLPPVPAVIAHIGGGPGPYALARPGWISGTPLP